MNSILVLIITFFSFSVHAEPDYETLSKLYAPVIEGDTLIYKGRVDSHFYDYLSLEAKKLENVKYISLNSYGGNHNWALDVAAKIQSLGKTTILKSGNVCASACVYLFAAGKERIMEKGTWLGVHGARLTGSYVSSFAGFCFVDLEDGTMEFTEKKKGCKDFLTTWYDKSFKATNDAFDLMEKSGISPEARTYYFSLPDDPEWYQALNVLKKPDWVVDTATALKYNLATEVRE